LATWNKFLILLLLGNFKEGFELYQSRWQLSILKIISLLHRFKVLFKIKAFQFITKLFF